MTKKKRYGLSPYTTRKHAKEFVDFDYLAKLTPRELDWLDKFSREYYQTAFKNTHRDLHNSQTERRELYNTNNARRRDVWTQFTRTGSDSELLPDNEDDK
jgi:hypothetical protein